jgi:hypothetical protein
MPKPVSHPIYVIDLWTRIRPDIQIANTINLIHISDDPQLFEMCVAYGSVDFNDGPTDDLAWVS